MNKYTCIIADDESLAVELLRHIIESYYKQIEVVASFTEWNDALDYLRSRQCDIVFLDISMQDKNGLDLIQYVPGLQSEIVFITAYSEYALEAFNVSAAGYLVKPINEVAFVKTVDKIIERLHYKRSAAHVDSRPGVQHKIGIPDNQSIRYVNADDIMYCKAERSYTRIFLKNGELISSYNLNKFRQVFEGRSFFQVHRSYIINLNHIDRYEHSGIVVMCDQSEIPVSKSLKEDFLKLFNRVKGDQE